MASDRHESIPRLGGSSAVILFAICLIAFVVETELAQYVQTNLGFKQPFFIFYLVHTTFAALFPLHLTYLICTRNEPLEVLWADLMTVLSQRLAPSESAPAAQKKFPYGRLIRLVLILTAGVTGPSLLWFVAVNYAPVTDVTAIWNTNAFFAYVLHTILTSGTWDRRRLLAVVVATLGTLLVIYGGSTSQRATDPAETATPTDASIDLSPAPLTGDLLTLAASVGYAAYQVLYKLYVSLPSDPENLAETDSSYVPIATAETAPADEAQPPRMPPPERFRSRTGAGTDNPELPFGLYPNMLTSAIGVCTWALLWIPIPIIDRLGIEPWQDPKDAWTYLVLFMIAMSGAIFNAGFMVLLGVWGPIVTSVGSLLTIVLVFISDVVVHGPAGTVTPWSLLGSGAIVAAFAILAYEMVERR